MRKPYMALTLVMYYVLAPHLSAKELLPNTMSIRSQARFTATRPLEPKQILKREAAAIATVYSLDQTGKAFAMGTGFIVRSNGVIVTNYHVIDGAYGGQIKLKTGEIYDNPHVLAYDTRRDLVILKVQAFDLPTVTLGSSTSIEEGDRVYAIGNPQGMTRTISEGLVSGRRFIEGTELLQITNPISHGSSGGPLYNVYGQVIGVTTASIEEAQNLNFAVSIKYVSLMLEEPPQNMTLTELAVQRHGSDTSDNYQPVAGSTYTDPSGRLELTLPAGWRLANPPEGTMLLAIKPDEATLVAYRCEHSQDAENAFTQMKRAISEKYGELAVYSEKVNADLNDGRHARLQAFRSSDGKLLIIGALQHDDRIIGIVGICSTADAFADLRELFKSIKW